MQSQKQGPHAEIETWGINTSYMLHVSHSNLEVANFYSGS